MDTAGSCGHRRTNLEAINNINPEGGGDINKPLPWIIIIAIFSPNCYGLTVFGWYAWKGEYDRNADK